MAVTYVGGATSSATSSVTSRTLTIPTVQNDDFALIVFGHGTANQPAPSGWTLGDAANVGSAYGEIFTRRLTAADSGSTVTLTIGTSQRMTATLAVYRGVDSAAFAHTTDSGTSTSHALVPVTAADGGSVAVTALFERSSTPSTVFTQPASYTMRQSSFGVGTGSCSSAFADLLGTVVPDGSNVGTGATWTSDGANVAIGWTIALEPSTATALTGTLTLVPNSGYAPLSVTATAAFTGGTGTPKEYNFVWGDGSSTGWQSSSTANHIYTDPGLYTTSNGNPVYVDCRNS